VPGEAVAARQGSPVLGYYGKVPTHGDFVLRRLPRSFLDSWDGWLQRAIAVSREQLAEAWLDAYLTSPIWRFALTPGVCGGHTAAGVLMPSVDSVGRYYPMTIAALLPAPRNPFDIAARDDAWFAGAEDVALSCLEQGFRLEGLDERLGDLGAAPDGDGVQMAQPLPRTSAGGLGWSFGPGMLDQICQGLYPEMLDGLLRNSFKAYSLWWSTGSDQVAPSLRIYEGLPYEGDFTTFLCGTGA
jgi:type VI secretion system protein ImpM